MDGTENFVERPDTPADFEPGSRLTVVTRRTKNFQGSRIAIQRLSRRPLRRPRRRNTVIEDSLVFVIHTVSEYYATVQ
jgi:hypothetical protein